MYIYIYIRGYNRNEVAAEIKKVHNEFRFCNSYQIVSGSFDQERRNGRACGKYVEVCEWFCHVKLKEIDQMEELRLDGRQY